MADLFILDEKEKQKDQGWDEIKQPLMYRLNEYLISKQSLKVKDKVLFFRLLATMINSWITLTRAISILLSQEKKEWVMSFMLRRVQIDIKQWKSFSNALKLFPWSFNWAEIWMIESWEKTWRLNNALIELAEQTEKLASINGKLKSALMYPAMIIIVVIWVVSVMMVMVVPELVKIFDWEDALPPQTRLLIAISDFFVGYWWLMLIVIFWWIVWLGLWRKTPSGAYKFDRFIFKIPVFGMVAQKIILSKFSRVLAWMLKSWVSIVESLRIVSEAVWNEAYRQRILFLRDDVKKWLKMHESVEGDPLFPEMLVSMIEIWEQTAKIDEVILKIRDFYDEEVDNTVWSINKLLEPIIIVILAVIIWFIAIAIMWPIMNIANTITT